jgi:excisionase family DNA binding protein
MTVKPPRILFDMDEAAEMLGISTRTLLTHVAAGELRFVLIGKRTRKFTERDIRDFIEAKTCQSTNQKIRPTGTTTSLFTVEGFMAARERRLAARRKSSKPASAPNMPKAQADESQA